MIDTEIKKLNALSIVIHDNGHAIHIQPISFGHHAFSESVSDVVRTKEGRNDDEDMKSDDGKDDGEPSKEDGTLVSHIRKLATRENTACVTGCSHGGFDERAEVAATLELVLDP